MEEPKLKYTAIEKRVSECMDLVRGDIVASELHVITFLLWLKAESIVEIFTDQGHAIKIDLIIEISDYEGMHKDLVENLLERFEHSINAIDDRNLSYVLRLLNSIDALDLKSFFPQLIESLIYKIARIEGRTGAEHLMPFELCRFMCNLFDTKRKWIYNPFAGLASVGVYMEEGSAYLGEEIDSKTLALGELRLLVHNKGNRALLFPNDCIEHWNRTNLQCDLIISNPPFGLKIKKDVEGVGNIRSVEHFIIHKGLDTIRSDGKILCMVPPNFLFREGPEQELRKYLIETDLLEMVISFPGGLMSNTGIPVCLVVINKNKEKKGVVRFVNAERFVKSISAREKKLDDKALSSIIWNATNSESVKLVPNEVVRAKDYNFTVNRYFVNELQGSELLDFVFPIPHQEYLRQLTSRPSVQKGRFLRIRDLKSDSLDYKLVANDIREDELPRQTQQINQSVLLLALRWSSLKPTFFEFQGESIYISPDIFALEVNTSKINLDYLIGELNAEYVEKQINSIRLGGTIPSIRPVDLVQIKLDVPSMEQQLAKVRGYKEAVLQKKKNELQYFQQIHGLESEIYEQNAFLRHSLAGPASNIMGSVENLKAIIKELVEPKIPKLYELKLSQLHTFNFGQYLDIIEKNTAKLIATIRNTTDLQSRIIDKRLYPIDLLSYLNQFIDQQKDIHKNDYEIIFQIDKEIFIDEKGNEITLYINGNEDLLADMINNLIGNAEKHAFPNSSNKRIEFFITANADESEKQTTEIVLVVSNTGREADPDFSLDVFCRKGGKIGDKDGEGYGGYLICEIIKYMNAKLDFINEKELEGPAETDLATSFKITFPIIQADLNENI